MDSDNFLDAIRALRQKAAGMLGADQDQARYRTTLQKLDELESQFRSGRVDGAVGAVGLAAAGG